MGALTRAEVREIDRRAIEDYGIAGVVLMENAGSGVAGLLVALGIAGPVAIACGPGNNGGDGFVIARHLQAVGHDVRLLLAFPASACRGDAAVNLAVASRSGLPLADMAACDEEAWRRALEGATWIVDALLGTGAVGPPRGTIAAAIRAINAVRDEDRRRGGPLRVLAIDLPSGLDADTGDMPGDVVRADVTATFVAAKQGFGNPSAAAFTGPVHVLGIGAPACLLERFGISGRVRGRGTCSPEPP